MTATSTSTSTRHLVDPELLAALDEFPPLVLERSALPEIRTTRAAQAAALRALQPDFPDIETSEVMLPGPAGAPDVRVLVYVPKNQPRPLPALLWIHGGGYVLGSADADDPQVKATVTEVRCAAVSVDYRLAPESPFPASVEDCYAALRWLSQQADRLGVDGRRIAIGGASAGGGLAAALGLLARDRGEISVAFQLLLVPMLDDRIVTLAQPHPLTGEFVWTAASNKFGWTSLLGREPGGDDVSAYASPARAQSLAGLPPTFIATGALDLFLEEDIDYARRLIRAGVPTELHVYPGAYHGFSRATGAWVTKAFERDFQHALQRALLSNQVAV